jgi:hypothetical protein
LIRSLEARFARSARFADRQAPALPTVPPFSSKARRGKTTVRAALIAGSTGTGLSGSTNVAYFPEVAGAEGIEPTTSGFGDQRSAN